MTMSEVAECIDHSAKLTRNIQQPLQGSLTIVSSFQHNKRDVKLIYDIVCTKDGKAWVAGTHLPLQLVDHTGKVHKSVELTPYAVYLEMSPSGDVLVSTGGAEPVETKVKKISPDGSVSVFTEVKSCQCVFALKFDSDHDLICLLEDTDSTYKLAKFDSIGNEIWRIQVGDTPPRKVCISLHDKCTILMGTEMSTVTTGGTFTERKNLNVKLGRIGPITYDRNGYLIVGTWDGKIHFFDQKLKCLQTYTLELRSVIRPVALAVDTEGRMWIGRNDGKVFVFKYPE